MSTLQPQVQHEFDVFFREHPRLRKIQKNVNILCSYLQQNKYSFPYTSPALAEAYRAWESALDLIPLPVSPPPQPQKQEEEPTPPPDAFHYRNGIPVIESPQPSPAGDRAALFARANQTAVNNYVERTRLSGRRH
jgi:hypothetical protein